MSEHAKPCEVGSLQITSIESTCTCADPDGDAAGWREACCTPAQGIHKTVLHSHTGSLTAQSYDMERLTGSFSVGLHVDRTDAALPCLCVSVCIYCCDCTDLPVLETHLAWHGAYLMWWPWCRG